MKLSIIVVMIKTNIYERGTNEIYLVNKCCNYVKYSIIISIIKS